MKHKLLLIYFLIFASPALAQNQHMNWHFSIGGGLNFSSGNPVPIGSATTTMESCASISDANGNPLFYTDGIQVWSGNHLVMPNGSGLLGHESSQCMIIPKPQSPGKYYIVATDAIEHGCVNGLTYSEVDMSLSGGEGDVTALKNIQLNALNGEWITAVPHANCVDTWIISHGKDPNNRFLAYHVSAAGINPTPVATNLGISVPINLLGVGVMRPNPAGTKIAMTRPYVNGSIELIDFDKATGIATGISNLYTSTTAAWSYGLEFSRSGGRLYSGEFGDTNNRIFQYDMTAANISATRTQVGQILSVPGEIGQLQIAPNDKIYVNYNTWPSGDFIGVINNPELPGTACGYVEHGVLVGGSMIYGLPWYYNPDISLPSPLELGPDIALCSGTTVTLSNDSANVAGATYLWSDGSTNPTLQVSESGIYWVQYQIGSCVTAIDSVTITIDSTQIGHLVGDTSGCTPFTIHLAGTGPTDITAWNWDLGNGTIIHTKNAAFTYTVPGIYTISLTALSSNNCLVQDSAAILAEAFPVPAAHFSIQPLLIEPDVPILFTDQSSGDIIAWSWEINTQQVSTAPTCTYTLEDYFQPLTVSLTVTNSDGCSDERKAKVFQPADLLYVPNTFTPDGNASNSVFKPVDYFGLIREFKIYNRWGETVWSETSDVEGWDGSFQGKPAPEGVYTWVITMAVRGVVSKEIQGHVALVR
jgi:gliding motility-associated-like protein